MNKHELYIYSLIVIHLFVWIYVFLGWIFLPNIHIILILTVLLPIFFIVQSMPCHLLVYLKLKYIIDNKHQFKRLDIPKLSNTDREFVDNTARLLSWNVKDIEDALLRLKYYDYKMVIPKYIYNARDWFDEHSFANPFNAQGLLIIAFMINAIALIFKFRLSKNTICYNKKNTVR